jgi:hypothetical protein
VPEEVFGLSLATGVRFTWVSSPISQPNKKAHPCLVADEYLAVAALLQATTILYIAILG